MSEKYPGVPGPDLDEYGVNHALNYQMWRQAADASPKGFALASNVSVAGEQAPVPIGPNRFHTFEVSGSATSFALTIYGSIPGSGGQFYPLNVTVVSGTASSGSITAMGIYTVEAILDQLQVDVTSVSGGFVTVNVVSKN